MGLYKDKKCSLIVFFEYIYNMIENIYNITPQQINYIIELNTERNFQRASEKCFVTQPTLSMQVKKVEDLIGFSIFDRARFPIEVTVAGAELIEVLKDIQIEYSRIAKVINKVNGTSTEQLNIAIIPTISSYLLFDIFDAVNQRLPHVRLQVQELKTEELVEAMEDSQFDLGILAGPYSGRRMRTVPLYQEEIKIYYPSFEEEIVAPSDLEEQQPWLLNKGNCLRTQMVQFCQLENRTSIAEKWSYEGGSLELLMKMVDLNGGYTLIPEFYHNSSSSKKMIDPLTNDSPARQIIGLLPSKSIKKDLVESLLKIIQLQYNKNSASNFKILDWK